MLNYQRVITRGCTCWEVTGPAGNIPADPRKHSVRGTGVMAGKLADPAMPKGATIGKMKKDLR